MRDVLCTVKLAFSPYVLNGMRSRMAYARLMVYATTSSMYIARLIPVALRARTIL